MDDRLIALLQAKGHWNADGISRSAKLGRCPDCQREVLRGLDGDRVAWPVMCDPHEIDLAGEVIAAMLGLQTYSLTRSSTSKGMSWNLDPRDPWAVRASQERGHRRAPIFYRHRCGLAVPPATDSLLPLRPPCFDSPPF